MTDSRDNTASKILDSLKNDIISGEYLPKQKLHIKTLKEKYNVGTSPLREALSQLMANDLVVSKNQRGFYVSDISLEDLTDIYQTRAKIESLCIEMSIDKGDDYWEANLIAASHRLNKYSKKDKQIPMSGKVGMVTSMRPWCLDVTHLGYFKSEVRLLKNQRGIVVYG